MSLIFAHRGAVGRLGLLGSLLALLALVVLAGACASGPEVAAEPSGPGTVAAAPGDRPAEEPTAKASPSVAETFAPTNEPPPELHLVGEDYEQVVRSHTAFDNWLFAHPDPGLVDRIYHPACSCYESARKLLAHYEQQGLWWARPEGHIVVRDVQVVDDRLPELVHLLVVLERPEADELIDSTGWVHERDEPRSPWMEDLVFVRGDPSSPWLLRTFN
ncbi:MAG: hypothetical protein M3N52_03490, partial [Actinomycetota bacterium]|nr:hypothetical protein [Actinomycetota bacterium]